MNGLKRKPFGQIRSLDRGGRQFKNPFHDYVPSECPKSDRLLEEQQAIVAKVEKLLAICDQLEAQITQNQTHAEALMQAVLKEAFASKRVEGEKPLLTTVI